jgi:hypothetical protein
MASVSMSRWTRPLGTLAALAGVLALVGACGTGGGIPTGQQFTFQAIGPEGGVVEAGPVRVTIPPGALTQDTGVAILPQATPLPIVGPDACTYSYVGPIHCCGPVGQNLLVPGTLRHTYDEALIPAGFTELDLVLLEWDNAAGVMRPRPEPPVEQDLAQNFFLDPQYTQLGHVAIGLRDCRNAFPFNLLIQNGGPPILFKPGGGATELAAPNAQLWAADIGPGIPPDGSSPSTTQVPTANLPFNGFVPSPNQDRVLIAVSDPQTEGNSVQSLRVDGVGSPVVIAASDPGNGISLQAYDPLYGWLRQGLGNYAYYVQYTSPIQATGEVNPEPPTRYEIWRRIGDASAPGTRQHFTDGDSSFLDDLRQSAAGNLMSAFSVNFIGGGFVDEVNIPAGTPASLAQVPPSDGPQPPRFMSASDDLYMVTTTSQEVNRHTAAGAFVETLSTLFVPTVPLADGFVDFALAPDGNTFAAVVSIESKGTENYLWMGTLTGGLQATYFLGFDVFVNEMVWHPMQTGVFLDLSGQTVALYKLNDDDGFYITSRSLFTFGMNNVDVNRLDGRIVTLFRNQVIREALQTGAQLPPGIYVWPPDASTQSLITPLNVTDPQSVRWLATWRLAAGRFSSRVR